MLNKIQKKALSDVATSLGVKYEDLYNLIRFESGFNPVAKNPGSTARGLIQFTDKTAQSLGYKDSLDLVTKNSTIESQLYFPVLKYLSQFKPFDTKQSLYMSVFYPKARSWNPYTEFPDSVKKVNPGISTVQDYINKAENKIVEIVSVPLIAGIGILIYLLLKRS